MSAAELEAGQKVIVLSDSTEYPGTVVKVGRVLFTVEFEQPGRNQRAEQFRLERSPFQHYWYWNNRDFPARLRVTTAEALELSRRRSSAIQRINDCGLSFSSRKNWDTRLSTGQLERIADLLTEIRDEAEE